MRSLDDGPAMPWPDVEGVPQEVGSLDGTLAEVLPGRRGSLANVARAACGHEITGRPIPLPGPWLNMVKGQFVIGKLLPAIDAPVSVAMKESRATVS